MLLVLIFAFFYPLLKYRHAPQNIPPFNIFPIERLSVFNIHYFKECTYISVPRFLTDVYVG